MKHALGRGAALVAAMAAALTLALTGIAYAGGEGGGHGGGGWGGGHDKPDCSRGTATGDGAFALAAFKFTVCAKGTDTHDATGFFSAMATPAPANVLVSPRGPVTCADFKGQDVSFFYPFDAQSMPPATPAAYGILIYAHDGGPNGVGDKIGFTILPQALSNDCTLGGPSATAAQLIAQPLVSGDISITTPGAKWTSS